jgi:hypothetical protein
MAPKRLAQPIVEAVELLGPVRRRERRRRACRDRVLRGVVAAAARARCA